MCVDDCAELFCREGRLTPSSDSGTSHHTSRRMSRTHSHHTSHIDRLAPPLQYPHCISCPRQPPHETPLTAVSTGVVPPASTTRHCCPRSRITSASRRTTNPCSATVSTFAAPTSTVTVDAATAADSKTPKNMPTSTRCENVIQRTTLSHRGAEANTTPRTRPTRDGTGPL